MVKLEVKGLKNIKAENWDKLNEILRFYNGFDKLIELEYDRLVKHLGNIHNVNDIMEKPMYITLK